MTTPTPSDGYRESSDHRLLLVAVLFVGNATARAGEISWHLLQALSLGTLVLSAKLSSNNIFFNSIDFSII